MNIKTRFETLPPIREIISTHNLKTRKTLGQHFLLDLNLTDRIARSAGNISDGTVFEIGPGPGSLTRSLLKAGARRVIAIERDPRCVTALTGLVDASAGRLEILEGDAQYIDLTELAPPPRRIVANLPYNISTVLLTKWISKGNAFKRMTLMFQNEVARRIVAGPGTKVYGRLSVVCNWRANTDFLFKIPARAFTPPPKISSALVSIKPHISLSNTVEFSDLERVTAAAFGQRRKMLRSSLKTLDCNTLTLLDAARVDPTKRAEELTIEDYTRLARGFSHLRKAVLQNH